MALNLGKCELLAPAGSKEAFIAAVECGADAIYIGGRLFNARINAGNFELDEMERAVDFAHCRGVRVYVAMNTLIFDDEIKTALEYSEKLRRMGVDALILQDLGFSQLLCDKMPDMPLHLSTQGSVYDPEGVRAAKKLGFERVVTARELSLEEIEQVCKVDDVEIETFVHGAICLCYSGQCQMSRYMGGRSGNRGACAQPCRHKYGGVDETGRNKSQKYWLSPSDLNLLDNIGYLIDAGVSSLKIEGRMKSPEYVAVVVSIYRKYMDLYFRNGNFQVTEEDRLALEQIFSRGGFTKAYMDGCQAKDFFSVDLPKHWGIPVGTVVSSGGLLLKDTKFNSDKKTAAKVGSNKGKSSKGFYSDSLVEARLMDESSLVLGDGIEIRGKGYASNVLTYMEEKNGKTLIGDFKTPVYKGDLIYRISSKEQQKMAKLTYDGKDWESGKFRNRLKCCIDVSILEDGLQIDDAKTNNAEFIGNALRMKVEDNLDEPIGGQRGAMLALTAQADVLGEIVKTDMAFVPLEIRLDGQRVDICSRVSRALEKSGNTPFETEVSWQGASIGPYQVAVSEINRCRRDLLLQLEDRIKQRFKRKSISELAASYVKSSERVDVKTLKKSEDGRLELYFLDPSAFVNQHRVKGIEAFAVEKAVKVRAVLPLAYVLCELEKTPNSNGCEKVLKQIIEALGFDENVQTGFYINNISKGIENEIIDKHYEDLTKLLTAAGRLSIDGKVVLYLGNLNWIERLDLHRLKREVKEEGLSLDVFGDFGLNLANELGEKFIDKFGLDGFVPSLELYDNRLPMPLMVTEAKIGMANLIDRKKERIRILKRSFSDQNLLMSEGRMKEEQLFECLNNYVENDNFRLYM